MHSVCDYMFDTARCDEAQGNKLRTGNICACALSGLCQPGGQLQRNLRLIALIVHSRCLRAVRCCLYRLQYLASSKP